VSGCSWKDPLCSEGEEGTAFIAVEGRVREQTGEQCHEDAASDRGGRADRRLPFCGDSVLRPQCPREARCGLW
jgi:hypothetical protein